MNNKFTMVMDKIVAQAETERQNEIRAEERRRLTSRIRKGVIVAVVIAVGVFALTHHAELQSVIAAKMHPQNSDSAASQTEGKVSSTLDKAQANAATRDSLVDTLAK